MPAPRKKNYYWIWFFAFIVLGSIGVAAFMIDFNLRQQLKPEQLEAAMQRWQQHGPADYLLTISKKINDGEPDIYVVHAQHRVIEVRLNGQLLRDESNEPYPAGHERLQWYTMDHLLREIEIFLDQDAKAGVMNFNVAYFDEKTGALEQYVRRVMSTRQRVQEQAKVERLPE